MKNIFALFTTLFLLTGLAKAQQQFANAGFEQWDTISDYTQPSSWYSLNPLTQFGLDASTTLTTNAHSGNYAVQLESISTVSSDLTGLLSTGPILDENGSPDFSNMKIPFSGSPSKLTFYYISEIALNDTSILSVCLTSWNISTNKTDTVAYANKMIYESKGVYTLASVDFEYNSLLPADSIFLIASSSMDGFNPTVGTKLILDDIKLEYGPTGLHSLSANSNSIYAYPNPVNSILTIGAPECNDSKLYLTDYTGRIVLRQNLNQPQVDVSNVPNGIYILTIATAESNTIYQKIIVQH